MEQNLVDIDQDLLVLAHLESQRGRILHKVHPADDVWPALLLSRALLVAPFGDRVPDASVDDHVGHRELFTQQSGTELQVIVQRVEG